MANPPVELESLRLLVAVDEHGSLGAAARSLRISQPAASARLRSLEARHQLALVTRTPRGSRLTEDGKAVCTWARNLLAEVESVQAGLQALSEQRSGGLEIAASMTIAEYFLPRWLADLRQAMPQVHPSLRVMNSTAVVARIRSGRIGLGFVEAPDRPAGLASKTVGNDRLAIVVSRDHPWASSSTDVPATLLAETPLVLREEDSGTRQTFDLALGTAPVLALEATSTSALIGAALAGVGPAVVSEVAVRGQLQAGTLVLVPHELDLRRPLRAVWRAGERLRSAAADLVTIAATHP